VPSRWHPFSFEREALVLRFIEDLCRDVGLGVAEQQEVGRLLGEG
jgi:hypothetical protein